MSKIPGTEKDIEILLDIISKRGMSNGCQEILPRVARDYLSGLDEESARSRSHVSEDNRGNVRIIYKRMNEVKIPIAKKMAGIMGKVANDFMVSNRLFTEAALNYFFDICEDDSSLWQEVREFIERAPYLENGERSELTQRYDKRDMEIIPRQGIESLSKDPKFYTMIQKFNLSGSIN